MNRIKENCAHFLAALLIIAICITLVACASSKADAPQRQQFSSPPTQEEIDEFWRTHLAKEEPNTSMVWSDLNTQEGVSYYDLGIVVEITGEREMRTVVYSSGNAYQHSLYRARIVDIIFNNPKDDYYRDYFIGEEVYVYQAQNYQFPIRANEVYLLVTNNRTDPDGLVNVWNGLRAIACIMRYTYYITENSYIIAIRETSEYNNTGRSSNEFIDVLRRHGEVLGWTPNDAAPAVEYEDMSEAESNQDLVADMDQDIDEDLNDSELVDEEQQPDDSNPEPEKNAVEHELSDDISQPDSDNVPVLDPLGEQGSQTDHDESDDIDDDIDDDINDDTQKRRSKQ